MRLSSRTLPAIAAILGCWPRLAYAADAQTQAMGTLVLKSVVSLAIVLALFAIAVWGIRRLQGSLGNQGSRTLKLESRISLDTRNSLAIVRHGDQRWLLGISPAGIARIDNLENESPAATEQEAA